jgi:hypothetical protein
MALLPFIQFELPGRIGPPAGRYLRRAVGGDPDATEVIVIKVLGAPRSRGRMRRGRPQAVKNADATPIPLTRVSIARPDPFADADAAAEWVSRTSRNEEASQSEIDRGLSAINLLLHSHRAATQDPYVREVGPDDPIAIRIGFGSGDEIAESLWSQATELPIEQGERRRQRMEDLQPQERVAAALSGRERIDACETLLLRTRVDYDNGRMTEAALQLRAAMDAMLVELPANPGPQQQDDLGQLQAQPDAAQTLARAALASGGLSEQQDTALGELLRLCERILRRRRLLGVLAPPEG